MPTFKSGKLVRDKIPNWHRERGHSIKGRRLSRNELIVALIEKLREETDEIDGAMNPEQLMEEIGDVQQIIDDLCALSGITKEDLNIVVEEKCNRRGGFLQGEYIDTVSISDEDDEFLQYCRSNPEKYPEIKDSTLL